MIDDEYLLVTYNEHYNEHLLVTYNEHYKIPRVVPVFLIVMI